MDGKDTSRLPDPGKTVPDTLKNDLASEQDDYEAASQAAVDYTSFTPKLTQKKMAPRVLGWGVVVLVFLALGGGAYWAMRHKSTTPTAHNTQQSSQNQAKITTTTKSYDSTDLSLSFNYPDDWTVNDPGSGKLTATSPTMQLDGVSGTPQTGQVVMTVQAESSADFSMFAKGNAIAVLASQKIAYTNPSSTQRADTYVSFLQYITTTAHGALDGVYVTGDSGYQQDQAIPEVDITKVDPLITITFNQCANSACTGTVKPLSVNASMWSDTGFSGPLLKMLESLAIQ